MTEISNNNIIIYQDDNEITRVSVRFADEDLWLTQNQLAEIYCTTQENISMHISNIYKDKELEENRTNKKFLLVRQEGSRQVFHSRRMDKKYVVQNRRALILLARRLIFYALLNFSFGCLQRGQRQSSGKSSNGVPGAIPCFASPCAGS